MKAISEIDWSYDISGSGEHLLFIHGWGVDRRIWRQQTKHFSQFYRVMSIDLPGHGNTSWKPVSLREIAKDINAILKTENFAPIRIIGSSLGGFVGLKIYELFPDNIKHLVFVGSIPKFSISEDYPYGLDVRQMKKLGGQLETAYPAIINIFFRSLFTKEERATRRFKWLQKFRRTDEPPMQPALLEYLHILEKEDLRDVLSAVRIPVNFLNGLEDPICTREAVEHIRDICPAAEFSFFEKCGHFPFLSKPYEFNDRLESLLKQIK